MSSEPVRKVEDLPQETQELSPEQAEAVEGGFIVIGGRTEGPQPHLRQTELLPYIEQDN
jgi:hypothetical protein